MFRDSRRLDCFLDRFLNHRLIQVVAALHTGLPVKILATCRKYELPSPLGIRVGILASNRIGQLRPPRAFAQIFLMNPLRVLQILDQILLRLGRQHRHPVFLASTTADPYFLPFEIGTRPGINPLFKQQRQSSVGDQSSEVLFLYDGAEVLDGMPGGGAAVASTHDKNAVAVQQTILLSYIGVCCTANGFPV